MTENKKQTSDKQQNGNDFTADVMPRYFYPDSSIVKENDIVFYSENKGTDEFHYADAINLIVKRDNDLKAKAFVITTNNARTFIDYEEPEDNMVSLKYGQNMFDENGILPDFKKIGEYPKNKYMLTKEYAMQHFRFNGA